MTNKKTTTIYKGNGSKARQGKRYREGQEKIPVYTVGQGQGQGYTVGQGQGYTVRQGQEQGYTAG